MFFAREARRRCANRINWHLRRKHFNFLPSLQFLHLLIVVIRHCSANCREIDRQTWIASTCSGCLVPLDSNASSADDNECEEKSLRNLDISQAMLDLWSADEQRQLIGTMELRETDHFRIKLLPQSINFISGPTFALKRRKSTRRRAGIDFSGLRVVRRLTQTQLS